MVNWAAMDDLKTTNDTVESSDGINSEAKDADTMEAAKTGFLNNIDNIVDEYGDYIAFGTGVLALVNFAALVYLEVID